jgi:hypothetical protein
MLSGRAGNVNEFKAFRFANQFPMVKNSPRPASGRSASLLKFFIRKLVQGLVLLFVVAGRGVGA